MIVAADLAALYGVPTKRFNEAVKRNLVKFPADFMFTLSAEEFAALRSQVAKSNDQAPGRGGRGYAPRNRPQQPTGGGGVDLRRARLRAPARAGDLAR